MMKSIGHLYLKYTNRKKKQTNKQTECTNNPFREVVASVTAASVSVLSTEMNSDKSRLVAFKAAKEVSLAESSQLFHHELELVSNKMKCMH